MSRWYIDSGKDSDVVISTRIRLARNLSDVPFVTRITPEQKRALNKRVYAVIKNSEMARDFDLLDMNEKSDVETLSMVEKHLISPDFSKNRRNAALILSHDENVSIMLCEEDHIRIQVMNPGLELEGAYALADTIDNILDRKLGYAFDKKLGYLTSCPTNLGTGMRASVMLHLPALKGSGQLNRLAVMVGKLGLTLRGAYGENSDAAADFYQLSNQVTLGISEKNALENLKAITNQLVSQERAAREELKEDDRFMDKVWRAMGTLKYAHLMDSKEFMRLVSLVRLGISQGVFEIPYETVSELIVTMQPATLMLHADATLDDDLRDKLRAKLIREKLCAE